MPCDTKIYTDPLYRHDHYAGEYMTRYRMQKLVKHGECKDKVFEENFDCVRCPRYSQCDLPERKVDKVFDLILNLREKMVQSMQLVDEMVISYRVGNRVGATGEQSRDAKPSARIKIATCLAEDGG